MSDITKDVIFISTKSKKKKDKTEKVVPKIWFSKQIIPFLNLTNILIYKLKTVRKLMTLTEKKVTAFYLPKGMVSL